MHIYTYKEYIYIWYPPQAPVLLICTGICSIFLLFLNDFGCIENITKNTEKTKKTKQTKKTKKTKKKKTKRPKRPKRPKKKKTNSLDGHYLGLLLQVHCL